MSDFVASFVVLAAMIAVLVGITLAAVGLGAAVALVLA